jgi:hypothetical protein
MMVESERYKRREVACPIATCRSKEVAMGRSVQRAVIAPLIAPGQPAPIYAFHEFSCGRCGHSFEANIYAN